MIYCVVPQQMAPELLAGRPASIRSDIYSLGVVLYQLIVGDFSRPVATDWWKDISDPLLREVPITPDVVQWHYDGITAMPPGAVLLASSPRYPTQAFRVGEAAWGLQFHIETTPEVVKSWAVADAERLAEYGIEVDRVLARLEEAHADVAEVWQPFTRRFAELVRRIAYDQRS